MIDFKQEQQERKALYMAAKMGLAFVCDNCEAEIYYPERKHLPDQIYNAAMPHWLHKSTNDRPCWNDMSDGCANPMSNYDLVDFYERIMKDEDEENY